MDKLIEECKLDCPEEKQIQILEKCFPLVGVDRDVQTKSMGWLLMARILERCSPQCVRAAQSRLGKKLIHVKNEPTIHGGIFVRQLLIRNPQAGNLHADVVHSIITRFIDLTISSGDQVLRRLCTELYSIRYGCDSQMSEVLLNTLSAAIANRLLSQEERTGVLHLKSFGISSLRDALCILLFELYSSSLCFAKAGQFVPRDDIMSILEAGLNDIQLCEAALNTIRSLCTNGKTAFLPMEFTRVSSFSGTHNYRGTAGDPVVLSLFLPWKVSILSATNHQRFVGLIPQVVAMLISKLDNPSEALFQSLTHICRIYGPGSTLFRHFYVIYCSLSHPLDEKDYGPSAGHLLSAIIQTSSFLVKPEVLMAVQRKICEEVVINPTSSIYRDLLTSFLGCTHELVPPPVQIARTVISRCCDTIDVQSLSCLCDLLTRPRMQNLASHEIVRRSLAKMERDADINGMDVSGPTSSTYVSAIETFEESKGKVCGNLEDTIDKKSMVGTPENKSAVTAERRNTIERPSISQEGIAPRSAASNACDNDCEIMVEETTFESKKNVEKQIESIKSVAKSVKEPTAKRTKKSVKLLQKPAEVTTLLDGELSVDEILSTFCPD
ncbi:hypothetical protein KIN20_033646 [Parelaphostrongylus tenuis]|uniref:Uncharacterized protein n=1 Tax=Parelaphostrongylus tenuis TaxID=148309 RepID=A0AAD5WIE9_PARTN|nr:hypothetical protein KIN20_033646 [Parelaphostrongylus tenuis]